MNRYRDSGFQIPEAWTNVNMGDQSGKKFLITGGTSGLGLAAATALTAKGGEVTITARDPKKGARAQESSGAAHLIALDLANLASIRDCAASISNEFDVVILNAGVMAIPYRLTADGFEMQLGTNHLGHFAFAGLIKNQIKDRLISVASQAHRLGTFGDHSKDEIRTRALGKGKYSPWSSYGDSKLANLLFVNEIERRRLREKWNFVSIAAHPGWANTNLQKVGPMMAGRSFQAKAMIATSALLAQTPLEGAYPVLAAATYPNILGASYLGPRGLGEMRGTPKFTHGKALAYDQTLAKNLWEVSEELTGVTWEN
jgi:NAD(P)-dependent dehydrogenase (short-subunit alcohol dehydrogenase family)